VVYKLANDDHMVSTPLKNMKVSWDDCSLYIYMETFKKHVPNHQPDGNMAFQAGPGFKFNDGLTKVQVFQSFLQINTETLTVSLFATSLLVMSSSLQKKT